MATITTRQYAAQLIEKYESFINNMEYAINQNKLSEPRLNEVNIKILIYKDVISDLKVISG